MMPEGEVCGETHMDPDVGPVTCERKAGHDGPHRYTVAMDLNHSSEPTETRGWQG